MPTTSNIANSKDNQSQGLTHKASSIVANEFHNFITDVENLFKSTTSLSGQDLINAKEKLYERIDSAKVSIEHVSESISRQTRKAAEITNNYAHEKPWAVIGASMGISFLAGFLISKRTKM